RRRSLPWQSFATQAVTPTPASPAALPRSLHSIFFFSSRRRHTRCYRDWSSDVCSSDLLTGVVSAPVRLAVQVANYPRNPEREERSGERRVGKECRCGRWARHEKKRTGETGEVEECRTSNLQPRRELISEERAS